MLASGADSWGNSVIPDSISRAASLIELKHQRAFMLKTCSRYNRTHTVYPLKTFQYYHFVPMFAPYLLPPVWSVDVQLHHKERCSMLKPLELQKLDYKLVKLWKTWILCSFGFLLVSLGPPLLFFNLSVISCFTMRIWNTNQYCLPHILDFCDEVWSLLLGYFPPVGSLAWRIKIVEQCGACAAVPNWLFLGWCW